MWLQITIIPQAQQLAKGAPHMNKKQYFPCSCTGFLTPVRVASPQCRSSDAGAAWIGSTITTEDVSESEQDRAPVLTLFFHMGPSGSGLQKGWAKRAQVIDI